MAIYELNRNRCPALLIANELIIFYSVEAIPSTISYLLLSLVSVTNIFLIYHRLDCACVTLLFLPTSVPHYNFKYFSHSSVPVYVCLRKTMMNKQNENVVQVVDVYVFIISDYSGVCTVCTVCAVWHILLIRTHILFVCCLV